MNRESFKGFKQKLSQIPSKILILYINKTISPRRIWSSRRLTSMEQNTAVCTFSNMILSSSICNHILRQSKFWHPVVKYWVYSVMSSFFWGCYNYNVITKMISYYIKVMVLFRSRVKCTLEAIEILWLKKVDRLENGRTAALFCFIILFQSIWQSIQLWVKFDSHSHSNWI